MNAPQAFTNADWATLNQAWLTQALAQLRERLEQALTAGADWRNPPAEPLPPATAGFCPALLNISQRFGLSGFETQLLLLLAGVHLDQRLRTLLGRLFPPSTALCFSQAMSVLPEPHWDALSNQAPLRNRLLIEAGSALLDSPLQMPERLLHHIAGVKARETLLDGIVSVLAAPATAPAPLPELQQALREASQERSGPQLICLQAPVGHEEALLATCRQALAPRGLLLLNAQALPEGPAELLRCARLLDREALLTGFWPLLRAGENEPRLARLIEHLHSSALLLGAPPSGLLQATPHRLLQLQATAESCRRAAEAALRACGDELPDLRAELGRAARQFSLAPNAIVELSRQLKQTPAAERPAQVWPAAAQAARARLAGLAQLATRIETKQGFAGLVLPPAQMQALRDMAGQLRQARTVFEDWGFGAGSSRGQGLCALFAGDSGTGKTLAAEAIAHELGLDLYRIDLALMVSKYIGETEKNLKQLFDAAEAGGALLLFDEADALFGKRSEVKDSHDRHANLEVAYLLQRIESYRGMAILTSNMKSALDRAFLRRIPFIVNFPFPDAAARALIWQRQFPANAPLGEIDIATLARLDLSGGHIRNVVLAAAFRAAELGQPIHQALLLQAARGEYAKLDRPPGLACREEAA
ncbi:hypothetical protein HNP55_001437 [Paucibacter oligotrophus]|uniref:AAA+ ATPase domain-containing protein n=1 Tax=Roseateles oligotrophus TaxID=1769250 RepID=A0A840L8C5_9BURK|nr:ATP-binding protein [Roseateles oligotrophus]MBB4842922.1 hypothetical protein [Roseateles oligotrophus]